jgi:putative nucleotidyltransferase with HDIG domain
MKIKYEQGDQITLPAKVKELVKKYQENGFDIYLVGGSTRGLLTGFEIADWDFATSAKPKQSQKLFPKNNFYNNKYGTVSIVMGDGEKDVYEVTTYRTEEEYSDFRRPEEVQWGETIEEDLSRRDFTINAIAIKFNACNEHCTIAEIKDPYNGVKDLKKGIIKAVGKPENRFQEDALRLLRAIRIATQLAFKIEKKTFQAVKDNAHLIEEIAWERIRDELFKLLASDYPADGIELLHQANLLKYIIPELERGIGVDQPKHHISTVWQHDIDTLRHCPSEDPLVRLAALLHDVGKPVVAEGKGDERTFYNHEVVGGQIAKEIGQRLRLSKKQTNKLFRLVRWHQFAPDPELTDSAIRRFIRRVGKENLQDILDIRTGDRLGSGVPATSWRTELFKERLEEVQKQPFSVTDLKINGNDVMEELDLEPGPKVGRVLNALFEKVKEDKDKNNREYLMQQLPKVAKKLEIK